MEDNTQDIKYLFTSGLPGVLPGQDVLLYIETTDPLVSKEIDVLYGKNFNA